MVFGWRSEKWKIELDHPSETKLLNLNKITSEGVDVKNPCLNSISRPKSCELKKQSYMMPLTYVLIVNY